MHTNDWREELHPRRRGKFTEKNQPDPGGGMLGDEYDSPRMTSSVVQRLAGRLGGSHDQWVLDMLRDNAPAGVEMKLWPGTNRIVGRENDGQWRRLAPDMEQYLRCGHRGSPLTPAVLLDTRTYDPAVDPGTHPDAEEAAGYLGDPADWQRFRRWSDSDAANHRDQILRVAEHLPEVRDGQLDVTADKHGLDGGQIRLDWQVDNMPGAGYYTHGSISMTVDTAFFDPGEPDLAGYPLAVHYMCDLIAKRDDLRRNADMMTHGYRN